MQMPTYGYQDPVVLISWQTLPSLLALAQLLLLFLCGFACAGKTQSVSDLSKAAALMHTRHSVNRSKKQNQKPLWTKDKKKRGGSVWKIVFFQHKCCPSEKSLRSKGRHFIKSELKPKKLRAAVKILQCLVKESLSDKHSKPLPPNNL